MRNIGFDVRKNEKGTCLSRVLVILTPHIVKRKSLIPKGFFSSLAVGIPTDETVTLLSKLKSTCYIDVDLDLSELDVTQAEAKATYDEIKTYVFDNYGLQVSDLYIAQVKAKLGIIERDCYNKPKSEDNRVPKCPPDKEKAIEDALRHFQMIKKEAD